MDRGRLNTSTLDRVSRVASTAGDAASIQISIDAIQWDISLVDKDVRKLVEVIQSKTRQAYAGTTNETEQGRAFLKKQLDVLMKEKAQYKEKKQALLQLQDNLPGIPEDEAAKPGNFLLACLFAYACSRHHHAASAIFAPQGMAWAHPPGLAVRMVAFSSPCEVVFVCQG